MKRTNLGAIILATACVFLARSSMARPQSSPPVQAPTISVDVNLIVLNVSVADRNGQPLSGLGREHFQVYEDSVLQEISLFEGQDAPAVVGVLIDNSASMVPKLTNTSAGARALVHLSNPSDQFFVLHFNDRLTWGLDEGTPFSSDPDELVRAVAKIEAVSTTSMYDALTAAITHAETGPLDKRVLVLMSDGADNSSRHSLQSVVRQAQESNVVIHTIGLYTPDAPDRDPKTLRELAKQTGGSAFFPETIDAVNDVARKIAADIRSEYTMGYVSTNQKRDGTFRRIRVAIRDVPSNRIHTRPGYIAPSSAR
jgi:VWFA-related protein